MREENNSVLSTPTEADTIGRFGQYRYIGETQISARYIGLSLANIFPDVQQLYILLFWCPVFEKCRHYPQFLEWTTEYFQGELHDYNMMIDRVNMNQELPDMVEDLDALKIKNDKEAESLERIFEQKESKEKQIEVLDREMSRQKTLTENRVQDMDPDMRQHYSNLKRDGLQVKQSCNGLAGVSVL